MKKLLVSGFLVVTLLAALTPFASARCDGDGTPSNIPIFIDGVLPTKSINSLILDATTYVSLRDFATAMGADSITWDGGTASVSAPGLSISATVGSEYIVANGRYLFTPDGCLQINNSVMVPVRTLAKAYDASLVWDDSSCSVLIGTGTGAIASGSAFYNDNDLYWLSRIISAEARGESLDGKIAVGGVIMNRLASPKFPKSVHDIIFDGIQFTPAQNGSIYNTPTAESVIAAKLVLDGGNTAGDSLYFASTKNCWAAKARPYEATIGNHTFYA